MLYVIETRYTGPDKGMIGFTDTDDIVISTRPGQNLSGQGFCIEGECDAPEGWEKIAHGQFATFEDALTVVNERFGPVRDRDGLGETFDSSDPFALATFRLGAFTPLCGDAIYAWLGDLISEDVDDHSSDDTLARLAAEYETRARADGYTLIGDVSLLLMGYRDTIRELAANAAETDSTPEAQPRTEPKSGPSLS